MTYPASTPVSTPTNTNIAIRTLFMTVSPSPSCERRTSVREELRKEALDAVPEPDGAIARVAPRGLRRGLGGLTRFLQLLATVLCAFGHRRTDALGGLFDAFPNLATGDLLRSAFDPLHPGLYLRIIGRDGEVGPEQREREYQHDDQSKSFHDVPFRLGSIAAAAIARAAGPFDHVPSMGRVIRPAYWTLAPWAQSDP